MASSERKKIFQCAMCKNRSHDFKSYMNHLNWRHQFDSKFSITCNLEGCPRTYVKFDTYRRHVSKDHKQVLLSAMEENQQDNIQDTGNDPAEEMEIDETTEYPTDSECESDGDAVEPLVNCELLQKQLVLFILKNREKFVIPKSSMNEIMSDVKSLMSLAVHISQTAQSFNIEETFKSISTDHLFRKYCLDHLNYLEPQVQEIGKIKVNDEEIEVTDKFIYIPIIEVLKRYLATPEVWASISSEGNWTSDALGNFKSGSIYKRHELFQRYSDALRLIFYCDEIEVVNPIGSAKGKHKLCCVYFMVDNIQSNWKSSLQNIHLCLIVKYKLIREYGYANILAPMIRDVKKLESTGMIIQPHEGGSHHRFGTIIGMCGDNLSSHAIGGFVNNFSSAFTCRVCLAKKDDINHIFDDDEFTLRTT